MHIQDRVPLLDGILETFRSALMADYPGYRNHCLRVYHLTKAFTAARDYPLAADSEDSIAIACAFHDLGIWTDHTFDYLAPSIRRAADWLAQNDHAALRERVALMIENHHKVSEFSTDVLVDCFRRADWLDVSLGVLNAGLPRGEYRALLRAFPDAGFHWRLVQLSARQLVRDPLHPLPMFRR